MRRLLLLALVAGSGCFVMSDEAPERPAPEPPCTCPDGQECRLGVCVELDPACGVEAPCAEGLTCTVLLPSEPCDEASCAAPRRCRPPAEEGAPGLFRCAQGAGCRSGICDEGRCLQPCDDEACPEGFACAPRLLEGGWSAPACAPEGDDPALTLCAGDASCAADRRCESLRPHLDHYANALPPPFVCRAGERVHTVEACRGGEACARGLCAAECRSDPLSLCNRQRCAIPCSAAAECPPGLSCRALSVAAPGMTQKICAPRREGGCLSDAYCCELVDEACEPSTAGSVCAVSFDGAHATFGCVSAAGLAAGVDCEAHVDCASGLCLDGACASPADPEGVQPCDGLGTRVTRTADGGALPFGLLAACLQPPPRSPCAHDGDCCWFVKELQHCPMDAAGARCVLDPAQERFVCDVPTGPLRLGQDCGSDAACVTGLCLDGRCAGPAPTDDRPCPIPGLPVTQDERGAALPHGLAAACSFAPSRWFGDSTAHDVDLQRCMQADAELLLVTDTVGDRSPIGDDLCAELGQGRCRAVIDFGCAVMACTQTVERARAVRCDPPP